MEPSGRKRGCLEPRCPTGRASNGVSGRRNFLSAKPEAKLASSPMVLDGIRRLAVPDLDEIPLERLAAHGEDLFVERKQAIPNDGIGRTVAAFANSLGGWLLLARALAALAARAPWTTTVCTQFCLVYSVQINPL